MATLPLATFRAAGHGSSALTSIDLTNFELVTVTNTNGSGAGSLRSAVEDHGNTPRVVWFLTSGRIQHTAQLTINSSRSNIYIAGQTSPGGILTYGDDTVITGQDVVLQHMTMAVGGPDVIGGDADKDVISVRSGSNRVLVMNVTAYAGADGNIDGGDSNFTMQECMLAENLWYADPPQDGSFNGVGDSKNMLTRCEDGISVLGNLFCNTNQRNPLCADSIGITTPAWVVNNVVFNGNVMEVINNNGGSLNVNLVGNRFITGDNRNPFIRLNNLDAGGTNLVYLSDNTNQDGDAETVAMVNGTTGSHVSGSPLGSAPTNWTTLSSSAVEAYVLNLAGHRKPSILSPTQLNLDTVTARTGNWDLTSFDALLAHPNGLWSDVSISSPSAPDLENYSWRGSTVDLTNPAEAMVVEENGWPVLWNILGTLAGEDVGLEASPSGNPVLTRDHLQKLMAV